MSPTWTILRMVLLTPWLGYLCYSDTKFRRLPNAWTLGGLAAGLVAQFGFWGTSGLKDGLFATLVAVAFILVPFIVRAAGAGDLKMLAACGAFMGMRQLPFFLMSVSFAGLLVALVMICLRQVSAARLKHCLRTLFDWRYDRKAGKAALPPKDDERSRVPFGVAIAIGAWTTLLVELCS